MLQSNIWRLLQFIRHTFKIRFVQQFPFLERVKKRIFMVTFFYHKLSWKTLCKVFRFVRHILKYSNVFLNPIDVCFTLFFSLLLQEYTSVNSETSLYTLYGNSSSFFTKTQTTFGSLIEKDSVTYCSLLFPIMGMHFKSFPGDPYLNFMNY